MKLHGIFNEICDEGNIVSILTPWPMDWLPYWTVVALHLFCFGHHVLLCLFPCAFV